MGVTVNRKLRAVGIWFVGIPLAYIAALGAIVLVLGCNVGDDAKEATCAVLGEGQVPAILHTLWYQGAFMAALAIGLGLALILLMAVWHFAWHWFSRWALTVEHGSSHNPAFEKARAKSGVPLD